MENKKAETAFEENRLCKTIAIAKEQLNQAKEAVKKIESGIMEAKKEIRENTEHSIGNLYSSEGFEALVELSQSINPVTEGIADLEEENKKIFRLENIIKVPYFARIDFQFEDEEEAEKVYIGRSSLTEKKTREMHIYDWRSPIAGVFYRFMTGKAFYEVPGGKIEGEVKLKRQYEIENGALNYFFDTDRNISDELLRQLLSQNTSPKMKAIVETIQKEQDIVIRDMGNDLLMVQGVAGSGKTSIALHRAAYLMYQGLQSKLSANSILIVSPNATFEQYISDVLPELGEENVASLVFEDVFSVVLKGKQIQSRNEFLELAVTNNRYKEIVKRSIEFKTSEQFREILDQLLSDIPLRWIHFQDIYYKGKCIIKKQSLKEWVLRRPETSLGIKLRQLEDYVLELIFGTARRRENAEEKNQIRQEIQKFTQFDIAEIYKKIFYDESYLDTLKKSAASFEEKCKRNFAPYASETERYKAINEILEYTRENLESGCLYYEDGIAVTYLALKIYGTGKYRNIKQVVIDEAQDYYPLQYEIFRLLFPNAKFTVLGDVNQTLAKKEDLSFYEQIQKILDKKSASLITLNKSFRCTNEILEFGLQFIEHRPEIQSFNRKGMSPAVVAADTQTELLDAIIQEIKACREEGFKAICLICKTEKNAVHLYKSLKSETDIQLIKDRKAESLQGTFIMPVYMSKGLEFDAVILCDADAENYYDEDDKKLLYVECTRALHRLSVFSEGTLSPLITDKN